MLVAVSMFNSYLEIMTAKANRMFVFFTFRPGLALTLFLSIFQFILVSVVFRDREFPDTSISIDNR